MRPTIVLLVGTSSAGKSTLAKRLQGILTEPYLLLGIDDVFRMVPERWGGGPRGRLSGLGFHYDRTSEQGVVTIRYGAVGKAILKGMHRAVAAFAEAGNNLIVDEMLLDERDLIDWIEQLGRFQPYLVQITAAEAVLERRERERQHGSVPGLARGHLRVNDLRHRDLLIDTTDQQLDVYTQALACWIRTYPQQSQWVSIARTTASYDSSRLLSRWCHLASVRDHSNCSTTRASLRIGSHVAVLAIHTLSVGHSASSRAVNMQPTSVDEGEVRDQARGAPSRCRRSSTLGGKGSRSQPISLCGTVLGATALTA